MHNPAHTSQKNLKRGMRRVLSATFICKPVTTVLTSGTLKEMISLREHSTVARQQDDCVWPPRVVLYLDSRTIEKQTEAR